MIVEGLRGVVTVGESDKKVGEELLEGCELEVGLRRDRVCVLVKRSDGRRSGGSFRSIFRRMMAFASGGRASGTSACREIA